MQENPPLNLRQKLALERTRLANERTFLAYVRTALSLLAAGVVLLQYFAADPGYLLLGWALSGSGAIILGVGVWRFFQVRRSLRSSD
ncbi:MAG: YidH family protein [Halioglobus sp.]